MIVASEKQKRQGRKILRAPVMVRATPRLDEAYHAALIPTDWGVCGIVWKREAAASSGAESAFVERPRDARLCRILTPGGGLAVDELRGRLMGAHPGCSEVIADRSGNFHPEVVPTWFPELARRLQGYYSASLRGAMRPDFSDSWHLWRWRLNWSALTAFQKGVLEVTATIPRGQRWTYGEVAKAVGKPSAMRAVGRALGANPFPVLIPCHRVVGVSGNMTGFSAPGGVAVKQRMLAMEACG